MRPFFIIQKRYHGKQRNVVRGARGVVRETRAATLQLRAVVLRHAPAWVVGDRNGHNKNRIDDADARGRRCGVAAWLSRPSGTSNTGITKYRVIPRVLLGNTRP